MGSVKRCRRANHIIQSKTIEHHVRFTFKYSIFSLRWCSLGARRVQSFWLMKCLWPISGLNGISDDQQNMPNHLKENTKNNKLNTEVKTILNEAMLCGDFQNEINDKIGKFNHTTGKWLKKHKCSTLFYHWLMIGKSECYFWFLLDGNIFNCC